MRALIIYFLIRAHIDCGAYVKVFVQYNIRDVILQYASFSHKGAPGLDAFIIKALDILSNTSPDTICNAFVIHIHNRRDRQTHSQFTQRHMMNVCWLNHRCIYICVVCIVCCYFNRSTDRSEREITVCYFICKPVNVTTTLTKAASVEQQRQQHLRAVFQLPQTRNLH